MTDPADTIQPPIEPMLAKIADTLPVEPGFLFEPKWDGFRALVFRHGDRTLLQSRDLKPLNRYFPELEQALHAALPDGCVLDGEIVVVSPGAWTSTRCSSASTPPRRASRSWRRRRRRASSPSTCSPRAAARRWRGLKPSGVRNWSGCWPARSRRCT
jgi:hypothetical protein